MSKFLRCCWLRQCALWSTLLLTLVAAAPISWATEAEVSGLPQQLQICEDASEWPPYSYYQLVNGKKSTEVVGIAVDVIREILKSHNISFSIEMHPWKRCLKEVEKGELFQLILSASYNDDRAQHFYFSLPYYSTHPYYFYSKKQHPQGLSIHSAADLAAYRVGSISGYNYAYLHLPAGTITDESIDHRHMILKLQHQSIDVFVEQYEVIQGSESVGKYFLEQADLGYAPVPGVPPIDFYMLMPRNALGLRLKTLVDAGIQELQNSGRMREIASRYFR